MQVVRPVLAMICPRASTEKTANCNLPAGDDGAQGDCGDFKRLSGINKYQYLSLPVSSERVNNLQTPSGPCRAGE